jgi:hypothetical protein
MVFNATFNNISVISWRSVLLVEEPGGPGEDHRPVASHWQDTKCVIVIRKSKKNRQYNDQKKRYKKTNNDLENIQIKLKIE